MIKKKHDAVMGLLFAAVGTGYLLRTLTGLEIGTAFAMGAGYLPMILSSILLLLGFVLMAGSLRGESQNLFAAIPWTALLFVSLAIVVFAVTLKWAGLFSTVALSSLIASLSRPQRPLSMLAMAIGVALFCTIVFGLIIGLPVNVIGNWRL